MIQITKEMEHYKAESDWLTTYHHFSFAEYYDPRNINFGPLRVFNDDVIKPGTGFDLHKHQDMEIVTYVIEGTLEHKDSLGNNGIIQSGEIQRMSAGSGVLHSEFNHSNEKSLRLLQIWLFSDTRGLRPSWEQKRYTKNDRTDKLLPVIGPKNSTEKERLGISQDATFYISNLEKDKGLSHKLQKDRMAYLFVIEGKITLNDNLLNTRDAAKIENEEILNIQAQRDTELILIDLPIHYEKNSVQEKVEQK